MDSPSAVKPASIATGNWNQLLPSQTSPSGREGASLTFDYAPNAEYSLYFGGSNPNGMQGDTWKFANGSWTELIAGYQCAATAGSGYVACPTPREWAGIAWDSYDHYVVLFGGWGCTSYGPCTSGYSYLSDTWEFKSGVWTQLSPSTSPSARRGVSMDMDIEGNGGVILFGGQTSTGATSSQTWYYYNGNWANQNPSTHPTARAWAYMSRTTIFGGWHSAGVFYADTWAYSSVGNVWSQLSVTSCSSLPSGSSCPTGRYQDTLTWTNQVDGSNYIMQGGYGNTSSTTTGCLSDEWELTSPTNNAWTWTEIYAPSEAGVRCDAAETYDFPTDQTNWESYNYLLMVGGYGAGYGAIFNDTLANGNYNSLTDFEPLIASQPGNRAYGSEAYDSATGFAVLFGGYDGGVMGDTWVYANIYPVTDTFAWVWFNPTTSPSPRYGVGLTYDANSNDGYLLLYGGSTGPTTYCDTWKFTGSTSPASTWTQLLNPSCSASTPPALSDMAITYDSGDGYVLMFGGCLGTPQSGCGGGQSAGTWTYTGSGGWVAKSPTASPSARWEVTMTYDTADGYPLLFGGQSATCSPYGGTDYCADTWKWVGSGTPTWTQIGSSCTQGTSCPYGRAWTMMAYDAYSTYKYVVLFGGISCSSTCTVYGDTWAYSGGTWTALSPTSSPPARWGGNMIYDPKSSYSDDIVLTCGDSGTAYLGDTWTYA